MEVTILKNEKGNRQRLNRKLTSENLLYQSFKNLWNNRQLKTIYFLFQELDYLESKTGEDGVDSQKKAYIQAIETILDMKENVVTHFITRVTTVL